MEAELVMISYLKNGRAWWILRVYDNSTFDLFYTCTQPVHDNEVPRQRYEFKDLEKVVLVGELKDWVSQVIGY